MEWYFVLPIALGSALVLGFCLWLFLVGSASKKSIGHLLKYKYAHRGLHGLLDYDTAAPENSLLAFERAVERGYGMELDVRLTKDGVAVVFHDDSLLRMCGVDKRVSDLTLAELKEYRLKDSDERIPTFREFLDTVAGRAPLIIELKGESTDTSVAGVAIEELSSYRGEYVFESFNPLLVYEVRKLAPKIGRGFLVSKHTEDKKLRSMKYRIIQRHLLDFLARPHFIACEKNHIGLFPVKFLARLFGTALVAFTVTSRDEEIKAESDGFECVIFEQYLA